VRFCIKAWNFRYGPPWFGHPDKLPKLKWQSHLKDRMMKTEKNIILSSHRFVFFSPVYRFAPLRLCAFALNTESAVLQEVRHAE
jgi:hypothetical protein